MLPEQVNIPSCPSPDIMGGYRDVEGQSLFTLMRLDDKYLSTGAALSQVGFGGMALKIALFMAWTPAALCYGGMFAFCVSLAFGKLVADAGRPSAVRILERA